ncbi:MAG TPA: hypothetical protein VL132_00710, partial [Planctomycetaceae bacterium]|nr:hypothetical protein [Planctomycetaceae bacterium]
AKETDPRVARRSEPPLHPWLQPVAPAGAKSLQGRGMAGAIKGAPPSRNRQETGFPFPRPGRPGRLKVFWPAL